MLNVIYKNGTVSIFHPNEIDRKFDGIKFLHSSDEISSILLEGVTKTVAESVFPNLPTINGSQVRYFGDMAKFVACNLVSHYIKNNVPSKE